MPEICSNMRTWNYNQLPVLFHRFCCIVVSSDIYFGIYVEVFYFICSHIFASFIILSLPGHMQRSGALLMIARFTVITLRIGTDTP